MSEQPIPVDECLSMLESARKGIEVKLAAAAKKAKSLYEQEIVSTLNELDRVADDLLEAGRGVEPTRLPDRRERAIRSALDRHALACSRMVDLIEQLDSYNVLDPIRIVESDLRAR